jgi:hypothetical protein
MVELNVLNLTGHFNFMMFHDVFVRRVTHGTDCTLQLCTATHRESSSFPFKRTKLVWPDSRNCKKVWLYTDVPYLKRSNDLGCDADYFKWDLHAWNGTWAVISPNLIGFPFLSSWRQWSILIFHIPLSGRIVQTRLYIIQYFNILLHCIVQWVFAASAFRPSVSIQHARKQQK